MSKFQRQSDFGARFRIASSRHQRRRQVIMRNCGTAGQLPFRQRFVKARQLSQGIPEVVVRDCREWIGFYGVAKLYRRSLRFALQQQIVTQVVIQRTLP